MRKSTVVKCIVAALVGIGISWLIFHPRPKGPVKIGETAPAFTLPQFPSGKLSLAQFHGKVVLVNFWATWCPPCVVETPSLEKFYSQMKSDDVTVIGVSVDENDQSLQKFVKMFHLTYPVARDPLRVISHRYGTFKYPETYIIGRDGHVAEKIIGATNWTDPRMIAFVKSLTNNRQASR